MYVTPCQCYNDGKMGFLSHHCSFRFLPVEGAFAQEVVAKPLTNQLHLSFIYLVKNQKDYLEKKK